MDVERLRQEVAQVHPWYHRIDLGHGIITPGFDRTEDKLKRLELPKSLKGLTVLDVGAWDGFFSFEAERRGAARVLATDSFSWGQGGFATKAGFILARKVLNSKVEDMDIDVLDLSPERVGLFDVVLFLGVLYHMRHPLLALERVFSVTGKQLILETHVDMLWLRRPAAAFYPARELRGDPTNWWGPNPPAVIAMLKSVGYSTVRVVSTYPLLYRLAKAARLRLEGRGSFLPSLSQGRIVVHAWRE